MKPCCKANRQMTASTEPEALVVWPVKPFVEELGYGVIIPDYPLCAAYTFRDAYASRASTISCPFASLLSRKA